MPDQVKLDAERKVSNPDLYKIAPEERPDKREYRLKKISEDIDRRTKAIMQYTGVERLSADIPGIRLNTMIDVLVAKGILKKNEFEDYYYQSVDADIQKMEADKDKIKQDKIDMDRNRSLARPIQDKKIILPGAPKMPFKIVRG